MDKAHLKLALAAVFFILPTAAGASSPTMCTMQYQPVCGAQQVQCIKAPCYPVYHTYGNSCTLGAEGGTFIHEGECTQSETGPVKPAPEPYKPPAGCIAWFDGCNSCSKSANGQSMCTLMACLSDPVPGRCTKYTEPKPTVTPPPAPATSPAVASTSVSVPAPTAMILPETSTPGFFSRIWSIIVSWFSWL